MIYRFVIVSDEAENFKLQIAIDSTATFMQLRNIILDSAGYSKEQMDSFYICDEEWNKEDIVIYSIGNKGRELLKRDGYEIKEELPEVIENPAYADAMLLTQRLLEAFERDEIGEIYLAYTRFKNTVSHIPTLLRLLPVETDHVSTQEEEQQLTESSASDRENAAIMNFEPEDVEALDLIIPKYITSLIYGAMMEAVASENGARMQAMDNATSNAEEMIDDLALKYNRARQGSITQELTEIIAGAEALG